MPPRADAAMAPAKTFWSFYLSPCVCNTDSLPIHNLPAFTLSTTAVGEKTCRETRTVSLTMSLANRCGHRPHIIQGSKQGHQRTGTQAAKFPHQLPSSARTDPDPS